MKINKLLIIVLIVFLIATVCVGCNNKGSEDNQGESVSPAYGVVYDQEIADEKYLKERISDATAIYYKSSVDGQFGDDRYLFEKSLLPKEYTELDYVQSTGAQCIDTGIKYADTLEFDLKFSDYTSSFSGGGIFGTEGWMFDLTRYANANKLIWCTEQKKYYFYNSFSPYKTYVVQCGKDYFTINDTKTISTTSSGIYGVQNITLFKTVTGYSSVKLYYFKIKDKGVIVRNYIPCYRNYDNAVGLYDLVSKRFYCNSTETNFETETTTQTIELPKEYQQVEYIESTGTQRIKLDVVPTSTFKIESTFSITNISGNSTIWCARGNAADNKSMTAFCLSGTLRCDYGITADQRNIQKLTLDTKYTLTMNSSSWYLNNELVATMDAENFEPGNKIQLFASYVNSIDNQITNWARMKLYSFKVYNSDRSLVLHVVPSYKVSNHEAGLYDVVNKVFYTNDGTGTFITGLPINGKKSAIPNLYQAVEYLDQVNPAAGMPSEHNRCEIASIKYDYIEARLNYSGSGTSGGILISGNNGEWWKSSQGGGSENVTMVPTSIEENTWTSVSWSFNELKIGLKTAGWSDTTNYWTPQNIKYEYIKTYNNSELTGYFIPCYRKADNAAGLYDRLSGNFYTNAGSGLFAVGNPIEIYEEGDAGNIQGMYQQVAYISTTGTQYIITDIVGEAIWEYDIQYDLAHATERQLMGHGGTSSEYWGVTDGKYGKSSWSISDIDIGNRDIFRVENYYGGGDVYINGVFAYNNQYDSRCENSPAQIFAIGGLYCNYCSLYSCKVYSTTGTLLRNFVPCYRVVDSVAGLYDMVWNKFYTNSGTGTFGVGEAVEEIENTVLPKAYQQLDYIKSTGTQYIDTNFIPDYNTGIEIKFASNNYENNKLYVYGAGVSHQDSAFELYSWDNNLQFNYGVSNIFASISFNTTSVITAYQKKTQIGYLVDGTAEHSEVQSANSFSSPYSMYLLALHRADIEISSAEIKLYGCKIWDNGTLVRDFIPCVRKEDSVVGLYDIVNYVFYTNAGTGAFVAGNPVETAKEILPMEYERADYLEAFGTGGPGASGQEIDLGIAMDMDNDWAEVTFQSTKEDQNGMILATREQSNVFWFYHYVEGSAIALYIRQSSTLQQVASMDINLGKHTFTYKNKQAIIDGSVLGTETRELGVTDNNLYLFSWGGDYHYSGKIYSCKIWKSGELVRNLVPCSRKADSVPGMYDLVNGVFYTNTGTGTFVAGNNEESLIPGTIISPLDYLEEYEALKYLTSTGEQYIDTKMVPSNDVAFEIAFGADNLLVSNAYVMGNGNGDGIEIYLEAGAWKVAYGSEVATFEAIPTTKTTVLLARKMLFVSYNDSSPSLVQLFTSTLESTRTLTLFATNREEGKILSSGINIYGFRMITNNHMCEYVPSIQKEDGAYGMYDGVQDKLIRSEGTSEFISSQDILSKLLPNGYHILEYVESYGKQYINTGIKDSSNTMFELDELTTSFSSSIGTTTGMNISHSTAYPGGYFYYVNRSSGAQGKSTINKRILFKMNNNLCYRDDVLVYSFSPVTKTDTQTIFLFGRNSGGVLNDGGDTKIFSCKIYENKMLVRYYVPACRGIDGEIGLYDLVSATFYTNEGEGEFSSNEKENEYKGIVLPSGYRQVEYIEGTGTQYFDTGILINKPDVLEYEIQMQYTSTTTLWSGANATLEHTYSYFRTKEKLNIRITYDGAIENIYVGDFLTKTNDFTITQLEYPNVHLMILAMGDKSETIYKAAPQPARVYSAKLIMNNELVLDCIPCYRESDGEAGLYDLVSQRFLNNKGTGVVLRGKEINNISHEYEQVDYIEYTGTQQITLPYNVTENTKVEIALENNTSGTTNEYPLVDISGSTLNIVNNIPTYNVFDAKIVGTAIITNSKYILTTTFDKSNALTINDEVFNAESITIGTFGNNIKLFGVVQTINGTIKINRIKLYERDVLTFDLIPCVRKYDGKIGFYEYLNREFYTPDIDDMECNVSFEENKVDNLYEIIDYVYFDEEHYLNLSYVGSTKFIFDVQFDSTVSNGLMGYTKMKDLNWGVKNGKYVIGTSEIHEAGNRDIIVDEYTTSSVSRYINNDLVATIALAVRARGAYRIGSIYDEYTENCALKLYGLKVVQDEKLIADFIPAIRKSDQSIGFINKVTNEFYVVYNNRNNFVMGNIVGHHFDETRVITEASESQNGEVVHVCSICGAEIHEHESAHAYKVEFTHGTGIKEIKVFKGYDLSESETTDIAYTRNENTNNFSRTNGQVFFEIMFEEGYSIDKIYTDDGAYSNIEENIYKISSIASDISVKILAQKN